MNTAFSPFAGYNVVPLPVDQEASLHNPVQTTAQGSWPHILSPNNPLFWFGVLAATSLGLIGVGGNVRILKTKASASVGAA